jgi:hypothetical protein
VHCKVLLLSQRRIFNLVAFCLSYEFEDVFAAVTGAERIDATGQSSLEFGRRVYKHLRLASGSAKLAHQLTPYPRDKVMLERDYELFFPIFSNAYQLYGLKMIPNWRERCHKAACFITEIWAGDIPEYLLELLSEFDHIFLGLRHSVTDVARISGRPCSYLPLASDVLRFAPASVGEPRPIQVCHIGRRSQITHHALLKEAERPGSFYYYDTAAASGSDLKDRTFRVDSPRDHRIMLATILKHSRYFIANRSHVNNPEFTAGRDEISARFYEGAAAGTVMIGEAPRSEEFKKQFDWPDAAIHIPFDCPEVGRILADLNSNYERLNEIRRENVRESAVRHDWLHRIRVVFDVLGLAPTEKMQARARQLEKIASRA